MRTEKVKLSGTHFFCVLKNSTFSTHMTHAKNPWLPLKSPISLQCQKETNKQDAHSFNSYRMTKLKNHQTIKIQRIWKEKKTTQKKLMK
jgi:hypothetical protein